MEMEFYDFEICEQDSNTPEKVIGLNAAIDDANYQYNEKFSYVMDSLSVETDKALDQAEEQYYENFNRVLENIIHVK